MIESALAAAVLCFSAQKCRNKLKHNNSRPLSTITGLVAINLFTTPSGRDLASKILASTPHRDDWIGPGANPAYVLAAREAQSRLQRWSYAELVNHSRRLTSSSESSPHSSGGSRVEDNAVILEHAERGSPHVEMWKMFIGDYNGERAYALWSVTMPGERDFWLYMLEAGPVPPQPELGTPLDPANQAVAMRQLIEAITAGQRGPSIPPGGGPSGGQA